MRLNLGPFWYESLTTPEGEPIEGLNMERMGYATQDVGPDQAMEGEVYKDEHGYGFLCYDTDLGGDCIEGEFEAAVLLLEELSGMIWSIAGRVLEGGEAVEADHDDDERTDATIIAQADEWTVEMDEGDDVALLDGEGTIRATMHIDTWLELVKSSNA